MPVAIVLVRNWWAPALRGALAVLFGVAAFVVPGLTVRFLSRFSEYTFSRIFPGLSPA